MSRSAAPTLCVPVPFPVFTFSLFYLKKISAVLILFGTSTRSEEINLFSSSCFVLLMDALRSDVALLIGSPTQIRREADRGKKSF